MQLRSGGRLGKRPWSGRGLHSLSALLLLAASTTFAAGDAEPLHVRIDRAIEAAHAGAPAALADDASFVRRLHLDLTGRIPGPAEARAFLDDPAPDKRAKLVDRLLAAPEHVRHLAVTLDVWLMERRADKHVKADEWRAWLVAALAANRPFNEIAREILASDGADPLLRPAAKFTLDRDVAPDAVARDVGRLLFGMDLQCAQCHDHPKIDDYVQRDYYGLYAFVNRTALFQPDGKKPGVVMEKPDGDTSFTSVFTKAGGVTRPRLPDGSEIEEPTFPKGEEYQVKPDPKNKELRPLPKFSRRAQLARLVGEGGSRAFARNAANRLWAHMMGRGLVEPVDLHHSDNPPSHPELLELLATEFAAAKYDLRAFLRQLALTRTYQRAIEMPAGLADQAKAAAAKLPGLEAEAKKLEEAAAKATEAAKKAAEALEAARKDAAPAAAELAKVQAAVAEAKKARDAAQKDLAARQDLRTTVAEAAEKAGAASLRIPGDADLAAAAETFRSRAGKLAAEVAAGEKDLAAKAAPLADGEKAAAALQAKVDAANAGIQALAKARLEAEAVRKTAKVAATVASRRAADATALVEYGALHAAASASREHAKRVASELALAKSPDELAAREAEAKKAHEAAVQARDAAQKDLAAKEEALKAVVEAAGKAEEVSTKAAKDAELAAAAARVKASRDRLGAEVAELRKALPRREEALRKAADQAAAAEKVRAQGTSAKERLAQLEAEAKPSATKAAADEDRREEAFEKLTTIWSERFLVADLSGLTPEQVAWSMMKALGVVDQQRAAAEAEVAKMTPPVAEADRAKAVEELVYAKLKGNEAPFVKLYGAGPGQPQDEFHATVDQALFLANGGLVRGWMAPAAGNLVDRLMKTEDPKELAREAYLSVFTRRPTEGETTEVAQYLAKRPQARLAAVQEIVWAMLSSVEFRFRH